MPGAVDNSDFACEHGGVLPNRINRINAFAVSVRMESIDQWSAVKLTKKGGILFFDVTILIVSCAVKKRNEN